MASRNMAGAIAALLIAAAAAVVAVADVTWVKILIATVAVVSTALALILLLFEQRAKGREGVRARSDAERARLNRLKTTVPGTSGRVPLVRELSAYSLGADPEAMPPPGSATTWEYLPRDCDSELRRALAAAQKHDGPKMIVLRGPSKAGKSRTLFEAVAGTKSLRGAPVVARRTPSRSTSCWSRTECLFFREVISCSFGWTMSRCL